MCLFTEQPANVAYQEIDITEEFPFRLRCYIPNTSYGSSLDGNTASSSSVQHSSYTMICVAL